MMTYTVRAMPAPGHDHRWRCRRPWGKTPTTITIVDSPKGPEVTRDEEGRTHLVYPNEISPEELKQLQADPHLAVALASAGEEGDPQALVAEKARAAELERLLAAERRNQQEAVEEMKRYRSGAEAQAIEAGGKIAVLQNEVETLRAQLGNAHRGKKG
jgi:hypothetical protein